MIATAVWRNNMSFLLMAYGFMLISGWLLWLAWMIEIEETGD